MRFEGHIKSWNEARGFGFLEPTLGGEDIFLHVSDAPRGAGVPGIGQRFTFEVTCGKDGRKRAIRVRNAGATRRPPAVVRSRPLRGGSLWPRVVTICLVVVMLLALAEQGLLTKLVGRQDHQEASILPGEVPAGLSSSAVASQRFSCDGRTYCSQMSSCAEARFFLANCPGVRMDGNRDGVPCEQQWCTSGFAQ